MYYIQQLWSALSNVLSLVLKINRHNVTILWHVILLVLREATASSEAWYCSNCVMSQPRNLYSQYSPAYGLSNIIYNIFESRKGTGRNLLVQFIKMSFNLQVFQIANVKIYKFHFSSEINFELKLHFRRCRLYIIAKLQYKSFNTEKLEELRK